MKLSDLLNNIGTDLASRAQCALECFDQLDNALGELAMAIEDFFGPDVARRVIEHSLSVATTSEKDFRRILERLSSCSPEVLSLARKFKDLGCLSAEEKETLSNEHYHAMLAFAERRGVREPSEVAAGTLVEVLDAYRFGRGDFPSFLYKRLRSRTIDWQRREYRRLKCEPLDVETAIPWIPGDSFRDADQLAAQLSLAWASLDLINQRLTWLRFVARFSFEEIVQQLDWVGCRMKCVSIRSRVRRSIQRLRPFLEPFKGDATEHDFIEAIHRVAKAAGTLTIDPKSSAPSRRAAIRLEMARHHCRQRRK